MSFRPLIRNYYHWFCDAILVYDVTDRETFDELNSWLEELNRYANRPGIVKMLVGTKIDQESRREVSYDERMVWAAAHNTLFVETSAKTGEGVECAFEKLVERIIHPGLCDLFEDSDWVILDKPIEERSDSC